MTEFADSVGASLPGAAPGPDVAMMARLAVLLLKSNDWKKGVKLNQKFTGREAQVMAKWLVVHGVSVGAALEAGPSPRDLSSLTVHVMRHAIDVEKDLPFAAPEVQLMEFKRRIGVGGEEP